MLKQFTVKVPASSGNLGPGFDVLGLALNLKNEVHVSVLDSQQKTLIIDILGEGRGSISKDRRNIVYRSIESVFKKAKKSVPSLHLVCVNRIPLARGLGSSSAAILSGLLIGNRLLKNKFSPQEILDLANEIEGHPDNVASALFGGVQASFVSKGHVITQSWPVPKARFVVAIPNFKLSTKKARQLVPRKISMSAAISNLSSVALMQGAFGKAPELLGVLLNDQWHEPYRAKLIPGFHQVKKAALQAGAFGVTLSGAGPTILSFVPSSKVNIVSKAMHVAFRKAGVKSQVLELKADLSGAIVK